jgi:hypothetical protein
VGTVDALLLGSFHMAGPGLDMVNVETDDVLAPHRQDEIAQVVSELQRFNPTKVAIERSHDDLSAVDDFAAFREGRRELARDESQQIGFRLARVCGHDRIYPIDVLDTFYQEDIELLLTDEAHSNGWNALLADGEQSMERIAGALRNGTIGDALRVMNEPTEKRAMLASYLDGLLLIASGDNWAGPDMVGNWYRRNFKIAANLHTIAEDGDRIAVVYGAGHIPVLEHVLGHASRFRLTDPLEFLPGRGEGRAS